VERAVALAVDGVEWHASANTELGYALASRKGHMALQKLGFRV
jgi:hypothetical protein